MRKRLKNSNYTVNVRRIDPSSPDPTVIQAASAVLGRKGVLVFPTSGLYGLGADALCPEAVERVFSIKRRPSEKPVLVLLSDLRDIETLVRAVPDHARSLMGLWPGAITLIFMAGPGVPSALTGGTGKIGVRLPAHPVARALTEQFGGPITGTSANLSGFPAPASVSQLDPEIGRQVDLILDAGTLAGGPGSTIVDVTEWPIRVLRQGSVSRQTIDQALGMN